MVERVIGSGNKRCAAVQTLLRTQHAATERNLSSHGPDKHPDGHPYHDEVLAQRDEAQGYI